VHSFDMKKDMGGMKKVMPQTFKTFVICTLALIGVPPLAGFWSKDEILTGGHMLGTNNAYEIFMVVGIIGAFMTAAYMTRCVYLTFYGEPRGAAADPHHHIHEHGKAILYPLYILATLAVVAGFANFPWGPDGVKLRFEHFVQPVGGYFPPIGELEFNWTIAIVSSLIGVAGIAIAYAYWFRGAFHGATERSRVARAGHTVLLNKYYFDHLYTGVIAAGTAGPVARLANWVNQNVIDGVVNGAGIVSTKTAGFIYRHVDQQAVDGVVNGSGAGAEGFGQVLRRMQTGKVQQYGALLFGGAVLLAGVLVFTL
jgi:NADH-quinone oxidoreductase subunit L